MLYTHENLPGCVRTTAATPLLSAVPVGPATVLLPPRLFYTLREWYAQEGLGRYRNRFFKRYAETGNEPGPRMGPS